MGIWQMHSSEWRLKIEDLGYQADKIKESGYASILDFGVAPMTMTQLILGFEKSCIYLLQQPKIIEAIMDKVLNVYMEQGLSIFESLGHRVDAIYAFADDLGTQHSLWLSPDHYRQIVKPYHRKIVDFIRKYSTAKIIFHSCGAIFDFIPDLIEIGIDALNPVQTSADGMEPTRLKSEYGKDLIFWGGIDTQHILPHGSPEDVRTEVRRKIDILSKNGGYVLAPVHNIQPDVPGENVWAMVDEARRYRT
jgi:uroporphyrinogen decarboxylase